MRIFPLPLIQCTIIDHNPTMWCPINLVLPTRSKYQSLGFMIDLERSQQRSMSAILSSSRPRASSKAGPTSPANGSPQSSRTESLENHSSVVSSSPKSTAWASLVASRPHWHTTVFSRPLMTVLNVASAQSIIGFGGRTRRTRSVTCGNSTSGWQTSASFGAS